MIGLMCIATYRAEDGIYHWTKNKFLSFLFLTFPTYIRRYTAIVHANEENTYFVNLALSFFLHDIVGNLVCGWDETIIM